MKEWGDVKKGPIRFEWGESIKAMGRKATLWIGDLQFMVVNEPEAWMPPHHSFFQIAWSRDRFWKLEFIVVGNRYRRTG